jgi:hypothetical protein
MSELARSSYNGGLLRVVLPGGDPELVKWNRSGWVAGWPQYRDHLVVFAYDWMGSQIAFDLDRRQSGEPAISILEPGTGKLLSVPRTFLEFITTEVVTKPEAALALELYESWRASGGSAPHASDCIGYMVPLFLGGVDEAENLEMWDMSVYLSLVGQAWAQARHLKPGTPIRRLRIS